MKSLGKLLLEGTFTTEKEDLICYGYDASGLDNCPTTVVWPINTLDVIKTVKFARENGLKIIPRGAGSGMTGGSVPGKDSLVISFEKMNRILEVDTGNLSVIVEPGVINGHLQGELEDTGFFYPPDPASLNICTIGGNVAENAGGPRALKYGVTRDYVMQLEAVLPDGRLISTGVQTSKGVVGYDLTRLLVGSEGTLAVVTKIRLRILPAPETVVTILCAFDSIESAGKTVSKVIASGVLPRTMEIMDRMTLMAVNRYKNVGFPENVDAMLLIELDGNRRAIVQEAEKVSNICSSFEGKIKIAEDNTSREMLWEARRAVSPALYKISPTKINEDIVVPISRVADILVTIQKFSEKSGIPIACFGHAGDGNIHVNVMTDRSNKESVLKSEKIVREIFKATLDMGGTISGEHGIGLTKAKYIDMELDSVNLEVMKGIKKLFDPGNILNPGKVFPS
ncbi:MAG: FAD-binding protein [Nitrospirae bacterium YQR-1]